MLGFNTLNRLELTFNALAIIAIIIIFLQNTRPTLFTTFKVTTILCLPHSDAGFEHWQVIFTTSPSLHDASKQLKTGPYNIAGKHLATFLKLN